MLDYKQKMLLECKICADIHKLTPNDLSVIIADTTIYTDFKGYIELYISRNANEFVLDYLLDHYEIAEYIIESSSCTGYILYRFILSERTLGLLRIMQLI